MLHSLKKALAILLSVLMLMSSLPTTALAAVGENLVETAGGARFLAGTTRASAADYTVAVGESIPITDYSGVRKHKWASSDSNIATVKGSSRDATVTGVAKGTVTITHSDNSGSSNDFTVEVVAAEPGISLSPETVSMSLKGETRQITAKVTGYSDFIVTWTSSDESVATVENGVVTAVGSGSATITATATSLDEDTEGQTCTATASVEVEFESYDLYFYGKIPGAIGSNADELWVGLGVAKVYGVADPTSLLIGTKPTEYVIDYGDTSKALYPDLTKDGVTYKYTAPDSENASKVGYYTLHPSYIIVANGANAGKNGYNPIKGTGTYTYHYDHTIVVNEVGKCSVNFLVQEPGQSDFGVLTNRTISVNEGTAESKLDDSALADTSYNGVNYRFDGWYKDEACTEKANFDGTITENTDYYGRYVPTQATYTVEYYYDGVRDDSKTETSKLVDVGEEISEVNEKPRTGYVKQSDTLPLTVGTDSDANVIRVYYVKNSKLSYTIEYYYDGELDASKTETVRNVTFGTEITSYPDKSDGLYQVERTENLPLIVSANESENVIRVYYTLINPPYYTVIYHYGDTDTDTCRFDEQTLGDTITEVEDLPREGYRRDHTVGLPLTIQADGTKNVVHVYYVKDESQTKETIYTVHYTIEGAEQEADKLEVTGSAWVNDDPAQIAIAEGGIPAPADKYLGYKLDENNSMYPAAGTMVNSGTEYTVNYVEDRGQTKTLSYTVEYYKDGALADSYTKNDSVWVNDPDQIAIQEAIDSSNDKYLGYKLDHTEPATLPAVDEEVANGTTIKLYYVKDAGQKHSVSYVVNYYRDGELVESDEAVTAESWIGEAATVTVNKDAINTTNKYTGYRFANTDPETIPESYAVDANAETGEANVINVYYVKDESQTKETIYTVHYTIEGAEQEADKLEVTGSAWVNDDPAQIAIAEGGIPAPADKYSGYKLDENNPAYPAAGTMVNSDTEYTVNYVKDAEQKHSVSYVVNYYKDGELVESDGAVTAESWIGEAATVTVNKDAINTTNKYTGYRFANTDPETIPESYAVDANAETGEANVINVYYVKRTDLRYVVNYLEQDTKKVLADQKVVENQTFGAEVTENAIEIEGYNTVNPTEQKITIAVEGNVINFYYTKRSDLQYTVRYLEQGTDAVLHAAKTVDKQVFGAEVTENAIDIEGYNKVDPTERTITIAVEGNVVTFYYTKRNDLSYTVNYLEEGTNAPLATAKTVSGQTFQAEVTENAVDIAGYNAADPTTQTITIGTGDNVVNFYYAKRTDLSYTVKYVEQGTEEEVAADKVVNNQTFGAEVTENAIDIDGYNKVAPTEKTITIAVSGNEIVFKYVKRSDLSYTVNYLEKDTNEILAKAKIVNNKTFGDVVTSADEKIAIGGYDFDSADKDTLTIGTGKNAINLYYVKRNDLSYTVKYYEKGTNAEVRAPKTVENQTFKAEINSANEVIEIAGYNYDSANRETLTIGTGDNVIELYYTRKSDLSYTVKYVEQGTGVEVADAKTEENQTFGAKVTEKAIEVAGYNKVDPTTAEIEIQDGVNEYTFYYTRRTDLGYTVNYLEQGSNKVLAEAKVEGNQTLGGSVTENAIDIAGYNKLEPTSATITIEAENNVINFLYAKRTDLSYTVLYLAKGEDGAPDEELVSPKTVKNQTFGAKIELQDIEVLEFPAYMFLECTPEALTIGADEADNVIKLYYKKYVPEKYEIRYYYGGQEDPDVRVQSEAQDVGTVIGGGTNEEQAAFIESIKKERAGYVFDRVVGLPLTIQHVEGDEIGNFIDVYYLKDESQTHSVSYTVEYYKDGVRVEGDDQSRRSEAEWIGQETSIAVDQALLNDNDKYDGYRLDTVEPADATEFVVGVGEPDDAHTIKVFYVKRTDLKYTVRHVHYTSGVELAPSVTVDGQTFGAEIKVTGAMLANIPGYKYSGRKLDEPNPLVIGTDETQNVITLLYQPRAYKFTVNYLDVDDGSVVSKPRVSNRNFDTLITAADERYWVEVLKGGIDGYVYDHAEPDSVTVGMDADKNVMNLYFRKRADLSYTVNYLEKDTDVVLATAKTATNQTFGAEIKPADEAIDITGYKYDSADVEALTLGTDATKNVLNLYYVKRDDLSYTVNYLEKDTNAVLADAKTVDGQTYKSEVTEEAIEIAGYNAVAPTSQKIEIAVSGNEITFYYTKRTDLSYTIRYLWNGTETPVRPDQSVPNQTFDSEVAVTDLEVAGYTLVPGQVDKITIGAVSEDNVITFYYYKNVTLTANDSLNNVYSGEEQSVSGFTVSGERDNVQADFSKVSAGAKGTDATDYKAMFAEGTVGTVDETQKYIVAKVESGKLSIAKRPVTIKAADAEKTYGEADPAFANATMVGHVDGKLTDVDLSVARSDAGDDTLGRHRGVLNIKDTKEALEEAHTNYTFTINPADFTVKQNTTALTVSAQNVVKTYDGTAYGVSATASVEGAVIRYMDADGNYVLEDSPTWTDVTGEAKTVQFKASLYGYDDAYGSATVTINKRPVTIKANDNTVTYDGAAHGTDEPPYVVASPTADTGLVAGHAEANVNIAFMAVEAGTYTDKLTIDKNAVRIMAGDADVTANYDITVEPGTLTIEKTEAPFEVTLEGASFVYDGTPHHLEADAESKALSGETTFKYALSADAETWVEDIAQLTRTDVGETTIHVRATNPNYANAETDSAVLTVTQRPVTIKANDNTVTYDGAAHGENEPPYVVASPTADTGLVAGHAEANVNIDFTAVEAGTYTDKLTIDKNAVQIMAGDADVTKNYAIAVEPGTLTIDKTSESFNVTLTDASFVYDGNAHHLAAATADAKTGTTTFEYALSPVADATWYNSVDAALLTRENVGDTTIYVRAANPNYVNTATDSAVLTVTQRPVTIKANDNIVTYDGAAHGTDEPPYVVASPTADTGLVAGHTEANVNIDFTAVEAGTYTDKLAIEKDDVQIMSDDVDVTENYDITVETGTLTIEKTEAPFEVTLEGASFVYDGTPHHLEADAESKALSGETTFKYALSADAETWVDDIAQLTRTDVGETTIHVRATNPNYANAETDSAVLTVTQRPVTIKANDNTVTYDGAAHGENEPPYVVASPTADTGLVAGHAEANVNIDFTAVEAGTYTDKLTIDKNAVQIMAGDADVTKNYAIAVQPGTLTIEKTKEPFEVTLEGASFVYDGTPHHLAAATADAKTGITTFAYSVDEVTWVEDIAQLTRTDVGETTIHVRATNPNYANAETDSAVLTVTQRPVTIKANDNTVTYDGAAHGTDEPPYVVASPTADTGLVAGHTEANVNIDFTAVEAGTYTDKLAIEKDDVQIMSDDVDVTENYDITVETGTLTIEKTEAPFEVTLEGASFVYDGTPHHLEADAESKALSGETTFKYALSADAETWVDDIAQLTRTDAGEATVYVRATNPNYANAATTSAKLTVTKRPVTIQVNSEGTVIYDGKPHGAVENDPYVVTNTAENEGLVEGHTATDLDIPTFVNVQEDPYTLNINDKTAKIVDKNGKDVTHNYAVTWLSNTLTITTYDGEVVVKITGHTGTYTYDGTEHVVDGYDWSVAAGSPEYSDKDFSFTDVDADGQTVAGVAEARRLPAGTSYMGLKETLFANTNPNFTNVTFIVEDGWVQVNPITTPITITAASDVRDYNGQPLTNAGYTYTQGVLLEGDVLTATVEGECKDVDVADNVVTGYTVRRGQADVTNSYTFKDSINGLLTVNPKPVKVITPSLEKTYDGTALTAEGRLEGIVEGETYDLDTTGSQTYVGSSQNTYELTWAEEGNGFTAKASNYTLTEEVGTLTVTGDAIIPEKAVSGAPETADGYKLGDQIAFNIRVENVTDHELNDIVVSDPTATIAEGEGYTVENNVATIQSIGSGNVVNVRALHTVTSADILKGDYSNTATIRVPNDRDYQPTAGTDEIDQVRVPLNVVKETISTPANGAAYALGETIRYRITAINAGNVPYANVVVEDALTGLHETVTALQPGESTPAYETEYTVTEADLLNGHVLNVATATADEVIDPKQPDAPKKPEGSDDEDNATVSPQPSLFVSKNTTSTPANGATYALGETITYAITATNNGNVTLTDVAIDDELTGDHWTVGTLNVNETSAVFTASHVVTEADLLAGAVANVATAAGTSPDPDHPNPTVTPGETEDRTDDPNPSFTVEKVLTNLPAKGYFTVGETAEFDVTVHNDGNLTLENLTVSEALAGATVLAGEGYDLVGNAAVIASIAPQQTAVVKASYTLTAEDLGTELFNEIVARGEGARDPEDEGDREEIPTDGAVEVSGVKSWNDQDNLYGTRPETITIRLMADGVEVANVQTSAETAWTYSFTQLPAHTAAGETIAYSIVEDAVTGYETAYDPESYNVTNALESHTLTVRYWYGAVGGAEAAPTVVRSYLYGQRYDVASPAITGYTPNAARLSGVISGDAEYDVVYTINNYRLTVRYVYSDGTAAAPEYSGVLPFDEAYSVSSPALEGFTASEAEISGRMAGRDLVYTVIYVPDNVEIVIDEYGVPLGVGNVEMNVGDCFE